MRSTEFSETEIQTFEPDNKVALLATVNPDGAPHISLITSLQAKSGTELMFGQFCEGKSKTNIRSNPKVGFLFMTQKGQVWRGKAQWTRSVQKGDDYDLFNQKPMFRYNAYFGIHTVHYLDLLEHGGKERLPVVGFAAGSLVAATLGRLVRRKKNHNVIKPWAQHHISKPTTLKFVSFVDDQGYPILLPLVPCRAIDNSRLAFAPTVSTRHFRKLSRGATVAMFALNLKMESVLVRGRFNGYRPIERMGVGIVDVDWVYNSMPPQQGQVYPVEPLRPVGEF